MSSSHHKNKGKQNPQFSLKYKTLSEHNLERIYEFCEENVEFWSQPLKYFKRATLGDTQYNENLTVVATETSTQKIAAFFMGTTRKSMILKFKENCFLKFFVVKKDLRRNGLATRILDKLYGRFKEEGKKGKISALTTPPDYWFSGVNPKFTPAYFWLKSVGFKRKRFHNRTRQDLYVNLQDNTVIDNFQENPVKEKGKYIFERVSKQYFNKTYEFVKEEFFGDWCEEAKLSFSNEPPTTYIAIEKYTDEVVGFATYNAQFYGSFGPTGIKKELRGKGIGSILLKWTLLDMKANGQKKCQILWVVGDTVKYYSKVVNAYIGEIYFPMKSRIS